MKSNKATYIFLVILFIGLILALEKMSLLLGNPAYPLVVFVFGLYLAIGWINKIAQLKPTSFLFRIPGVGKIHELLNHGSKVPFWHRQAIFLGGFAAGFAWLHFAG